MASLKLKHIYKVYEGGVKAVNDFNMDIEDKEFIVPPMEQQEQFAVFVSQVDKSKAVVQKTLDEAQVLFDSLMQKYYG